MHWRIAKRYLRARVNWNQLLQEAEFLHFIARSGREKMLEISQICDAYQTVTRRASDESLLSAIPLLRMAHGVLVHQLEIMRGKLLDAHRSALGSGLTGDVFCFCVPQSRLKARKPTWP